MRCSLAIASVHSRHAPDDAALRTPVIIKYATTKVPMRRDSQGEYSAVFDRHGWRSDAAAPECIAYCEWSSQAR
ncbi:MAG: hypothetical protein ACI8PT_004590 [Gammaproteobacteria bacterium]|jgi:hypothetical protein